MIFIYVLILNDIGKRNITRYYSMQLLSQECRRSGEKLHDDMETVTFFSYPCNILYSEGGCEAAVTSITRL